MTSPATLPPDLPSLDATARRLLGLTLDDLRQLPARSLVSAVALVARRDDPAQALRLLDALRDEDGGNGEDADGLLLDDERIRLLLEAGRHGEAAQRARLRLERKESLTARGYLVRALLNAGALDEADQTAQGMLVAHGNKITALYSAGLVALARHDLDAARGLFDHLRHLHPDSPAGPRGLARVALAEGDPARALDLALQAIECYSAMMPPADLLRELARYAGRAPDTERTARAQEARRRIDEAQAAHDEALRERLRRALDGEGTVREKARASPGTAGFQPAAGRRSARSAMAGAVAADTAGKMPARAGLSAHADWSPRSADLAAQPRPRDQSAMVPEDTSLPPLPPAPPPDPALHDGLIAALGETFGYDGFRAGQEEIISAVMGGHDTLAVMPTGAGKSLCYQLPAALREGATLVVSPLIALMKDQVESLPPALLARTTLVNSTLESAELALRLGEIAAGRYRLVYAAPERLRQRPFIHALARAGVRLAVIDEAHCLSMWGHDFRPDYLYIRAVLPDLGNPQVLAMTATATPEMMRDIAAQLGRTLHAVNTGVLRDNLYLIARQVENDDHKLRIVLPFVERQARRGSGIVYVNSRDNAEKLERELRRAGINARAYHAGMGAAERNALHNRFMDGEVRVMVATVAFGMGIDKADVRFIVHYHPPHSLEAYSQESGRAGRDGKPAVCLLLHSRADRANLTRWSREEAVAIEGLRAVYRVLRGLLPGGSGLVDAAMLRERLERDGHGAVEPRVAISLLGNAGLLRRGADVPRGATLTPTPSPPAPLSRTREGGVGDALEGGFATRTGGTEGEALRDPHFSRGGEQLRCSPPPQEPSPARVGGEDLWQRLLATTNLDATRPTPIDMAATARLLNLDVAGLEDCLLAWQDEGRLSYRGVGREMSIEIVPPPPDAAARMSSLLDAMGRRNRRRLHVLLGYLDTDRCRHAFIGRHFGHEEAETCRRCDVCRPVELEELRPVAAARIDDPSEAVRRLVGDFPLRYGRSGVVEVLKGATTRRMHAGRTDLFGALAHLSKAAIERAIDALLADGTLAYEMDGDYRMLRLNE